MRDEFIKRAEYAAKDKWYDGDSERANKRTVFQHDIHEITYSATFRKLAFKSQVILKPKTDLFRSRLTHTLEVAEIACSIGQHLGLNEELIQAISLSHDVGHVPFAHIGEETLNELLQENLCEIANSKRKIYNYDDVKFKHSINSKRVLLRKMKNISKETYEGVTSHGWCPWSGKKGKKINWLNYEAQIVAISDQLAGTSGDFEDLLEAQVVKIEDINQKIKYAISDEKDNFKPEEMKNIKRILTEMFSSLGTAYNRKYRLGEAIDKIVTINKDVLACSNSPSDASRNILKIPSDWKEALRIIDKIIRDFIKEPEGRIANSDQIAKHIIQRVFHAFYCNSNNIGKLKEDFTMWKERREKKETAYSAEKKKKFSDFFIEQILEKIPDKNNNHSKIIRLIEVIDYIANMTDRYLFDIYVDLHSGVLGSNVNYVKY